MNPICEKCGRESNPDTMMPNPEDPSVDYCFECYERANVEFQVKAGKAFIQGFLPTMDQFVSVYSKMHGLVVKTGKHVLEGYCHSAAILLVQILRHVPGMKIQMKRGHWLGTDVREKRKHFPGQQHSWTSVEVEGNPIIFIVDPTQFIFTGASPHIVISDEDDRRYDPGSFRFNEMVRGPRTLEPRNDKLIKSGLKPDVRKCMERVFDSRDWRYWTYDELFEIANTNPERFGIHAKAIYQAIDACGRNALIPFDAYREVMGEPT